MCGSVRHIRETASARRRLQQRHSTTLRDSTIRADNEIAVGTVGVVAAVAVAVVVVVGVTVVIHLFRLLGAVVAGVVAVDVHLIRFRTRTTTTEGNRGIAENGRFAV